MKKRVINICLVLGTVAGLLLLFFPHISFLLAGYNQSYVSQQYNASLQQMDKATQQQSIENAKEYNKRLLGDSIEDPFLAGSGKVLPEDYLTLLNINGTMGQIKIPKIKVDLPIYHGTDDATLQKGAGHLEGTSLPVGGESTHTVITGHTGLSSAKMFTDLVSLKLGDEFYIYVLGQTLAYRVDDIKTVTPNAVEDLRPVIGKEYATLITCTPYGINSHRLLVRGVRIPYTAQPNGALASVPTAISAETILLVASLSALGILLLLAGIVTARAKRQTRRKKRLLYAKFHGINYRIDKKGRWMYKNPDIPDDLPKPSTRKIIKRGNHNA
ncbi:class C sortase [Ruminococcaceae bacterium OttesenSCG-928-A16]|nr:class C sortase [Ruminococcaceae bacterium OttesenSCG-928-A16]